MKSVVITLSVVAAMLVATAVGLGMAYEEYFAGDQKRNDQQDDKIVSIEKSDKVQQDMLIKHTEKIENADIEISKLHQANRTQDKRMDQIDAINKAQDIANETHTREIKNLSAKLEAAEAKLKSIEAIDNEQNRQVNDLNQRLTESNEKAEKKIQQLQEDIEQIKRLLGLAPPQN